MPDVRRQRPAVLRAALYTGLALLMVLGPRAHAESVDPTLRIKAAFILNFLKYTEWPAEAMGKEGDELSLAVLGDDPLAPAIRTALDGRKVQGRALRVRVLRDVAEWKKDPKSCHALFLTPSAGKSWPELQTALASRPVVTIAETPGFCAAGGMLNLVELGEQIRFEANPEATTNAGLKLRADLLILASIVKKGDKRP